MPKGEIKKEGKGKMWKEEPWRSRLFILLSVILQNKGSHFHKIHLKIFTNFIKFLTFHSSETRNSKKIFTFSIKATAHTSSSISICSIVVLRFLKHCNTGLKLCCFGFHNFPWTKVSIKHFYRSMYKSGWKIPLSPSNTHQAQPTFIHILPDWQ